MQSDSIQVSLRLDPGVRSEANNADLPIRTHGSSRFFGKQIVGYMAKSETIELYKSRGYNHQ